MASPEIPYLILRTGLRPLAREKRAWWDSCTRPCRQSWGDPCRVPSHGLSGRNLTQERALRCDTPGLQRHKEIFAGPLYFHCGVVCYPQAPCCCSSLQQPTESRRLDRNLCCTASKLLPFMTYDCVIVLAIAHSTSLGQQGEPKMPLWRRTCAYGFETRKLKDSCDRKVETLVCQYVFAGIVMRRSKGK